MAPLAALHPSFHIQKGLGLRQVLSNNAAGPGCQRGVGLGSFLKKAFAFAKPLVANIVKSAPIQRGLDSLKRNVSSQGRNFVSDIVAGEDVATAAKKRLRNTADSVMRAIMENPNEAAQAASTMADTDRVGLQPKRPSQRKFDSSNEFRQSKKRKNVSLKVRPKLPLFANPY